MATTTGQKAGWISANVVAIILAIFPVLWIVSLSFKRPDTITDHNFVPRKWTLQNYRGIFKTSEFTHALLNSIGIAVISTREASTAPMLQPVATQIPSTRYPELLT